MYVAYFYLISLGLLGNTPCLQSATAKTHPTEVHIKKDENYSKRLLYAKIATLTAVGSAIAYYAYRYCLTIAIPATSHTSSTNGPRRFQAFPANTHESSSPEEEQVVDCSPTLTSAHPDSLLDTSKSTVAVEQSIPVPEEDRLSHLMHLGSYIGYPVCIPPKTMEAIGENYKALESFLYETIQLTETDYDIRDKMEESDWNQVRAYFLAQITKTTRSQSKYPLILSSQDIKPLESFIHATLCAHLPKDELEQKKLWYHKHSRGKPNFMKRKYQKCMKLVAVYIGLWHVLIYSILSKNTNWIGYTSLVK